MVPDKNTGEGTRSLNFAKLDN